MSGYYVAPNDSSMLSGYSATPAQYPNGPTIPNTASGAFTTMLTSANSGTTFQNVPLTGPNFTTQAILAGQAGVALQVGILSGVCGALAVTAGGQVGLAPRQAFMFALLVGAGGEMIRELAADYMFNAFNTGQSS